MFNVADRLQSIVALLRAAGGAGEGAFCLSGAAVPLRPLSGTRWHRVERLELVREAAVRDGVGQMPGSVCHAIRKC